MPTDDFGRWLSDDGAWVWDSAAKMWRPRVTAGDSGDAGGPVTGPSERSGSPARRADDFFAVERVGETDDRPYQPSDRESSWDVTAPAYQPSERDPGLRSGSGSPARPAAAAVDPFDVSSTHDRPLPSAYPSVEHPPYPVRHEPWTDGLPNQVDPGRGVPGLPGTPAGHGPGHGSGRWDLSVGSADDGHSARGAGLAWQSSPAGPGTGRDPGVRDRQPEVPRGFGPNRSEAVGSAEARRNWPPADDRLTAFPAAGQAASGAQAFQPPGNATGAAADRPAGGSTASSPPPRGFAGATGRPADHGSSGYTPTGADGPPRGGSTGGANGYPGGQQPDGYGVPQGDGYAISGHQPPDYPGSARGAAGGREAIARSGRPVDAGSQRGSGNRAFDQTAESGRMERDDARRRPEAVSRTVLLPEPPSPAEPSAGGYSGYPPGRPVPRRSGTDDRAFAPPDGPARTAARRADASGRATIPPPLHRDPAGPRVDPLTAPRTPLGPATALPLPALPPAPPSSGSHAAGTAAGGTPELDRDSHHPVRAPAWDSGPLSQGVPPAALPPQPPVEAAMTEALRLEPAPESVEDDGWKPSTTVRKKTDRGGAAPPRVSSARASSADAISGMATKGAKERRRALSGRTAVSARRGGNAPGNRRGVASRTDFDPDLTGDTDLTDDIDIDDEDDYPSGIFARYRHGWVGPLAIAVLVSLVAIGVYVMVTGGKSAPEAAPTSVASTSRSAGSQTSTTSNPDAAAGLALIDGAYRCYQADSADLKPLAALPDKLVIPMGRGAYSWNAQQGTYTIAKNSLSTETEIFADVQFTAGPLKDVKALFFNRVRQGDAGKDVGGLTFEDGTNRWCAIN
ncbi:hypothetical protein [Frankia sp. Cj3]|uniref:hypothetical protein n=1 Tax=Frankia sp. Cj3 TaxID=2880976 RepID=UPI001EF44255|nr:hypothetical protein [Frankia sp. Cj3]